MDDSLITSLVSAFCLVVGGGLVIRWVAHARQRRAQVRRAHGYELIHSLRAYSAWIECQRDLPFTARSLDELTSPWPLTRARQIKRDWFPDLSEHMVRLLQAHSRMVEYLWEQSLLRLSQGSPWQPAHRDVRYQQLRGAQEDLIDETIALCRKLIGDSDVAWRATGSDFAFSNSAGSGPASQA